MNVLFGNFTLFAPLIKKVMLGIPQTKAMLSTGISFTTMFAGQREDPQIRAKEVETTMFLRCVREEDLYQGLEKIRKIAARYGMEIQELERDYCQPTSFAHRPYQLLEEVLQHNFPDVIVAPFLLTAGTDARRFTDVADSILRFAPSTWTRPSMPPSMGRTNISKSRTSASASAFIRILSSDIKECNI